MSLFGNNDEQSEKKQRKEEQDRIRKDAYVQEQYRIRLEQARKERRKNLSL